jgi:hypothetical protein
VGGIGGGQPGARPKMGQIGHLADEKKSARLDGGGGVGIIPLHLYIHIFLLYRSKKQ